MTRLCRGAGIVAMMAGWVAWSHGSPPRSARIVIDASVSHQTIEGFGATFVDWQDLPEYGDPAFIDTVVNDLGLTILRVPLFEDIEPFNDDDDPDHFNWDGFMTGDVDSHWSFTKRMMFTREFKKRGVTRYFSSIITPPPFTKTTRASNYGGALRVDMLEEYAEFVAANIILAKKNHDIDISHVSIQNELLFIEFYQSCIYSPELAREAVRALMRKFKREGIGTRILMPEDMMTVDRMRRYIEPTMADPETRHFPGAFCTHRLGGIDEAREWDRITRPYGRQNWMTETSGHPNNWVGAMQMASDMYDYLVGGNFSVWLYYQISFWKEREEYSLMVDGRKTPKYHAAKHFFRYIRPGAVRIDGLSNDREVLVSAFRHDVDGTISIVLINTGTTPAAVTTHVPGADMPGKYELYISTERLGCEAQGEVAAGAVFDMPAKSIVTLYGRSQSRRTDAFVKPWPVSWTPPAGSEGETWGVESGEKLVTESLTDSFTPLHHAILASKLHEVDKLLNDGANMEAAAVDGWTPLHMAAATFAGPKDTAETRSLTYSKHDVFARVMKAGPDVNRRTTDGWTPLHAAAASAHTAHGQRPEDNVKRVRDLLEAGATIDAVDNSGRTPLHWAAWQGYSIMHHPPRPDIVRALLESGADVNRRDMRGRTPLHYAAEMGYDKIVPVLLAGGADAMVKDKEGKTPEQLAAARGLKSIVEIFRGGPLQTPEVRDLAATPPTGSSGRLGPELLQAAREGDLNRVSTLLAKGADPHYRDSDGFRPSDRARDAGHTDVVKRLRQAEEK